MILELTSSFEVADPRFRKLAYQYVHVDKLYTGCRWAEGPAWFAAGRYLVWSDIPNDRMLRWDETDGSVSVFRQPSMNSNGHTVDLQGRLVSCEHLSRCVSRTEFDGKRTVLADRFEGKQFNGPNDVIVKRNGTIYFTDTYGGLRLREKDPRKGLDFQGVYMIKGGKVSRIIDDIPNPNGLALSPDEKILYANGSRDKYVRRYRVLPDDTVADSQMFIDISGDPTPGITDGLKVDVKGNVWESAAGGVWIISPEGKHLGTILTPELVANVEFGDPDHKTLYIAARTSVYKIRVNIAGVP